MLFFEKSCKHYLKVHEFNHQDSFNLKKLVAFYVITLLEGCDAPIRRPK